MKYWIAIGGQKKGPLTLDELRALQPEPNSLVWHEGLPTWVEARTLAELDFGMPQVCPEQEQQIINPSPVQPQPVQPQQAYTFQPQQESKPLPPMPPTYLGWSIAAVILCCTIPAIVAVIYASRVSSLYQQGEYEKAQKSSEKAEIWLIVSVVLALISLPFTIAVQLMAI